MACVSWSFSGPRPLTYSVDDDETGSRIFAKTPGFLFRLLSGGGGLVVGGGIDCLLIRRICRREDEKGKEVYVLNRAFMHR